MGNVSHKTYIIEYRYIVNWSWTALNAYLGPVHFIVILFHDDGIRANLRASSFCSNAATES